MLSYQVAKFGQPLERVVSPTPTPTCTEVLLEVTRCGVCHSDLHMWHGYYDLGPGKRLDMQSRGMNPPFTMGHEVLGRVVAVGPEATGVAKGDVRLIYPWIGCGACSTCLGGNENLCAKPQFVGVFRPGGYSDHVVAPHPRYLLDVAGLDPAAVATYACSGLTAYSAIGKLKDVGLAEPVAVIGAGGVGQSGIVLLRALGYTTIIVGDLDPAKLETAKMLGASAVVKGTGEDALAEMRSLSGGGLAAAIDFVGSGTTAQFAIDALRKGGRYVVVGLFGGELTIPVPFLPMRALSLVGSYVGNLAELTQLLAFARSHDLPQIPIETIPLDGVNAALARLEAGTVRGRVLIANS